MLDELIDRYGEGAIVRAWPRMLESGESYRWELEIDGIDDPEVYAHVRRHPEQGHLMVMLLVHGDEEVEIGRWPATKRRSGPAAVIRRLGDLR